MPRASSNSLIHISITISLCAAIFGSYCLANAMTHSQTANLKPMIFPTDFGEWKTITSQMETVKPDVVAHRLKSPDGKTVGFVVRRNPANALLHDLTSCLISAQASAKVIGEEKVETKSGKLNASIVEFTLQDKQPRLALMWFQAGKESAQNRWAWRTLSATSPLVRECAAVYQAEVTIKDSGDNENSLRTLRNLSSLIFEEIAKR